MRPDISDGCLFGGMGNSSLLDAVLKLLPTDDERLG